MESTVTSKGQVTLPSELRKRFGIARGQRVVFAATSGGILVKPAEITVRDLTKEAAWQESLKKSLAQAERGEGKFYANTEEFLTDLGRVSEQGKSRKARKTAK
jgi:AbrB family looped-hinge helix DNA binding protein